MPTLTRKRIGPTLLTAAAVTQYTVPALTQYNINTIWIANTSATAATAFVSIGTDAAGTRIVGAVSIAANSVMVMNESQVPIEAGEIIQAYSGTASVLTLTIGGFTEVE